MFTVDSERFRRMNRDADMFVCFSRVHPWYGTGSVVEFNIYAYFCGFDCWCDMVAEVYEQISRCLA